MAIYIHQINLLDTLNLYNVICQILWPPDIKSRLIRKDPNAGKDRRQEKKGTTEDKMVGWHLQLNGHGFEQASGDGERQGSLASCSLWGRKESNMTEQLKTTTNMSIHFNKQISKLIFKINEITAVEGIIYTFIQQLFPPRPSHKELETLLEYNLYSDRKHSIRSDLVYTPVI